MEVVMLMHLVNIQSNFIITIAGGNIFTIFAKLLDNIALSYEQFKGLVLLDFGTKEQIDKHSQNQIIKAYLYEANIYFLTKLANIKNDFNTLIENITFSLMRSVLLKSKLLPAIH